MKFTSMFGAVALAAAMSTQAIAGVVASDNFDSYDLGDAESLAVSAVEGFSANGWTVVGDDASKIIATHFDNCGQALDLSTGGNDLTFNAETAYGLQATVSMKVQMVCSDTMVDMSADTQSHTALFLYSEDLEGGDKAYTLKAFSYDVNAEENVWVDLVADGFSITDKEDVDVSIAIDYNQDKAVYTVKGVTFPAVQLANPTSYATTKKLSSVSFKGTGVVDDLFVSEEAVGDYATFIYQVANEDRSSQSARIDVEDFGLSYNVEEAFGYLSSAELWLRVDGENTTKLADLELDADGNIDITDDVYTFVKDETYVILGIYTPKPVTITIVDGNNGDEIIDIATSEYFDTFVWVAPEGASWEYYEVDGDEYEGDVSITDLEEDFYTIRLYGYSAGDAEPVVWTADTTFGSIQWTSYDPVAGTATFEWTAAEGFNPAEGDVYGEFKVIVSTELGGTTSLAGSVTVNNDVCVVTDLPTNGDALFLLGIADAEVEE